MKITLASSINSDRKPVPVPGAGLEPYKYHNRWWIEDERSLKLVRSALPGHSDLSRMDDLLGRKVIATSQSVSSSDGQLSRRLRFDEFDLPDAAGRPICFIAKFRDHTAGVYVLSEKKAS